MATWVEVSTVLGVQDMYDLLEVILVDAANQHMIAQNAAREKPVK